MRAILTCICHQAAMELEVETLREMGPILTSAIAAFHAAQPHCSHPISIEMESVPSDKELHIRCFKEHCDAVREMRTTCPIELVGALTLCFHTSHEGHPIEITFDGRRWCSSVAL
jgi:hypothetical protein